MSVPLEELSFDGNRTGLSGHYSGLSPLMSPGTRRNGSGGLLTLLGKENPFRLLSVVVLVLGGWAIPTHVLIGNVSEALTKTRPHPDTKCQHAVDSELSNSYVIPSFRSFSFFVPRNLSVSILHCSFGFARLAITTYVHARSLARPMPCMHISKR